MISENASGDEDQTQKNEKQIKKIPRLQNRGNDYFCF